MTGADFVYSVLGPLFGFVCFMAVPLLAMSLLHMIGKP